MRRPRIAHDQGLAALIAEVPKIRLWKKEYAADVLMSSIANPLPIAIIGAFVVPEHFSIVLSSESRDYRSKHAIRLAVIQPIVSTTRCETQMMTWSHLSRLQVSPRPVTQHVKPDSLFKSRMSTKPGGV
jgi:hypothetical protein